MRYSIAALPGGCWPQHVRTCLALLRIAEHAYILVLWNREYGRLNQSTISAHLDSLHSGKPIQSWQQPRPVWQTFRIGSAHVSLADHAIRVR